MIDNNDKPSSEDWYMLPLWANKDKMITKIHTQYRLLYPKKKKLRRKLIGNILEALILCNKR